MAEVTQNANGKWKIVDIKHDDEAPSDVTIPATFTYKNKEVHLSITTEPQTVETNWVTQLGVKLNINEVDRKYKKVTKKVGDEWKTYEAYDEFSDSDVKPFVETLSATCTNTTPGSTGGTGTLSISSNTSWVITVEYEGSDTGWIHVPVTAGTGDTAQPITFDANTGTTQRIGTIVVKTGTKEERIHITQAGFVPSISISATTPIDATATSISYGVTANVSKVKVKLGSTTKTTKTGTFTISENTATTPVSYVITASCTDYPTYTATTTVSQNAAGVELDASCSNTAPGSQQSTATLTIDSNVNWTISTNVDWITVATPLTGSGDATRNVTFAANSSTSQRTGKITVTGGGVTKEITITQAGVNVNLTASCTNTTPESTGGTGTLSITSNTSWTISTDDTWITIATPLTGTNNGTRTVTFGENTNTSQRTGTITVTGSGVEPVEINIIQAGKDNTPRIISVDIKCENEEIPVQIFVDFASDRGDWAGVPFGTWKAIVQKEKESTWAPSEPEYASDTFTSTAWTTEIEVEDYYEGNNFMFNLDSSTHTTDWEASVVYSSTTPNERDFTTWRIPVGNVWHNIKAERGKTIYVRVRPVFHDL